MKYDFSGLEKAWNSWVNDFQKPETIKIKSFEVTKGTMIVIFADRDSSDLDRCIKWADQQLKNWSNITSNGYNTWIFANPHDAEKFKTLFLLYQNHD